MKLWLFTMIYCFKKISMEYRQKRKASTRRQTRLWPRFFWACKCILFIDFKEDNTTVKGTYYAALLHKLCQIIWEKQRGKVMENVAQVEIRDSNKLTILRIVQILSQMTITHIKNLKKNVSGSFNNFFQLCEHLFFILYLVVNRFS